MSKTTLNLMARIERRLNKLVDKEVTHCGHDELVMNALRYRNKFMEFLSGEIETLVQKAGLP